MSAAPAPSPDLLPLHMLNEYAYCPRLFHLMHVEGRFEDNEFTVEGRHAHRRVDELDHLLPEAASAGVAALAFMGENNEPVSGGDDPPVIARSVPLSSDELGLSAKLDLVSTVGDEAIPVETKRGRVPDNFERSWEPERVQLMAQGLLLRKQGFNCDHGILYFAGSRTRVRIDFSPALEMGLEDSEPAVLSPPSQIELVQTFPSKRPLWYKKPLRPRGAK